MHGHVRRGHQFAVLRALHERGVGVDLQVAGEEDAEGLEHAAVEVAVVLLVEDLDQVAHAQDEAHAGPGVAAEVLHQLVVLLVVADQHGLAQGAQQVGAVDEVLFVHLSGIGAQVVEGDLEEHLQLVAVHAVLLDEHVIAVHDHINVHLGHRAEASADGQDVLLVEGLGGLQVAAVGPEDHGVGVAALHQLQAQQAVVHPFESRPVHLDHVHLHHMAAQVVVEPVHDLLGLVVVHEAAVEQVHADDADLLLLQGDLRHVQADMDHHVAGGAVGGGLEAHAQPAVPAVHVLLGAGGHGVGEGEELAVRVMLAVHTVHDELVLVPQHVLQAALAHEAVPWLGAVDGVAELLVVGAHRLGDGAGGTAGAEEVAYGLLPGADLGEGAVEVRVTVDAAGLLKGAELDAFRIL